MSRASLNPLQLVYALPRFFAGKMLFVDSTYGLYTYHGTNPAEPCRSINQALDACLDDRDDVIIVMDGYNNTLTDAEMGGDDVIDIDVDGVTVLSAGRSVTVQAIAVGGSAFQIDADGVTLGALEGCYWTILAAEAAGDTSTIVEIKTGATCAEIYGLRSGINLTLSDYDELITIAATAHSAYIHDCYFKGDTTDTNAGIKFGGTVGNVRVERVTLINCGSGSTEGNIASSSVQTNCLIKDCIISDITASKYGINMAGASATGVLIGNKIMVADEAKGCVNQLCYEFDQLINDAAATQGGIVPARATVTSDKRAKMDIVYLMAA